MSNTSQQPYIYKYCLDYYNTNLLNSRYPFLITFKERIKRRLNAIKFQCRVRVTVSLYHLMLYQVHLVWVGFELTISVVIGTDCIGNCKSNYDTIMTTTALSFTVTEIVGKKVKRWQVNLILYTVYELQNICYQSWKIGYGTFAKRWGSTVLQSAVIPLFRTDNIFIWMFYYTNTHVLIISKAEIM
jgi:hypothetical protein